MISMIMKKINSNMDFMQLNQRSFHHSNLLSLSVDTVDIKISAKIFFVSKKNKNANYPNYENKHAIIEKVDSIDAEIVIGCTVS